MSRRSYFKIKSPTMTINASKMSFNFLRLVRRPSAVHLWVLSTRCVDTIPRVNTLT